MTKQEQERMKKFDAAVSECLQAWRIGKISLNDVTLYIIKLINKERNPWMKRQMANSLICTDLVH